MHRVPKPQVQPVFTVFAGCRAGRHRFPIVEDLSRPCHVRKSPRCLKRNSCAEILRQRRSDVLNTIWDDPRGHTKCHLSNPRGRKNKTVLQMKDLALRSETYQNLGNAARHGSMRTMLLRGSGREMGSVWFGCSEDGSFCA